MEKPPFDPHNPWLELRRLTPARIALGRTGTSMPTRAQLDFQYAHAQARDAVHLPFDHAALSEQLGERGRQSLLLHSAAPDRNSYLQRPDLGRKLSVESAKKPARIRHGQSWRSRSGHRGSRWFVGIGGASPYAAVPGALCRAESADGWSIAPVILVEQGRVAVADEIGELLGAKMTVILIGERPGLSSPDSLGLYFTYNPKVGLTDAYRNCISNVRLEGLTYGMAAHRLLYLMREACRRQLSGVNLKDEAQVQTLESDAGADLKGNFLLDAPQT